MAHIGLVFPGQGSQKSGMGKDFYESFSAAKQVFDIAHQTLALDLKTLCFEGSEEDLRKTENTQPALYLVSLAIFKVFTQEAPLNQHRLIAFAGHSLGEYSAYAAAGYFSLEDGLRMVRRRGELMAEADPEKKGTMASILKMDDAAVEELCNELAHEGILVPANYNSPGQIAISGERSVVEKAVKKAAEKKGIGKLLPVGGAFHSPLMEPASHKLSDFINPIPIHSSAIPVVTNVYAKPVAESEIKNTLVKQLTSPVRWTQSIESMVAMGVDTFIEIGTGKVLQGLIKRIATNATVLGIEDLPSLESTVQALR